jgi:hypothetical protein
MSKTFESAVEGSSSQAKGNDLYLCNGSGKESLDYSFRSQMLPGLQQATKSTNTRINGTRKPCIVPEVFLFRKVFIKRVLITMQDWDVGKSKS